MRLFSKIRIIILSPLLLLTFTTLASAAIKETPDRFERGLRGQVLAVTTGGEKPNVTVQLETGDEVETILNLDVAAHAKVWIAFQEAKLGDVKAEMYVSLRLAGDHRTVNEIHARGKIQEATLQAVIKPDGKRVQVTLTSEEEEDAEEEAAPDPNPVKEFDLAPDAVLSIGGLPALREHFKEGLDVTLELAKGDQVINVVEGNLVDDRMQYAKVTGIDATAKTVQLAVDMEDGEMQTWYRFDAAKTTRVDNKPAQLADLKIGMYASVRLSPDLKSIEALSAEQLDEEEVVAEE